MDLFTGFEYNVVRRSHPQSGGIIHIKFEFAPIRVTFHEVIALTQFYNEEYYMFAVQLCAIIGGIMTVAGVIDSMINQSMVAMSKKQSMGKLS